MNTSTPLPHWPPLFGSSRSDGSTHITKPVVEPTCASTSGLLQTPPPPPSVSLTHDAPLAGCVHMVF
jgi:hypothetical protein